MTALAVEAYEEQLCLLDAIAEANRPHAEIVEAVIREVGREHGGIVDPNIVRARLRKHFPWVRPSVVGAVYSGLARSRRAERVDSIRDEDLRSRNRNKELGLYRLVHPAGGLPPSTPAGSSP